MLFQQNQRVQFVCIYNGQDYSKKIATSFGNRIPILTLIKYSHPQAIQSEYRQTLSLHGYLLERHVHDHPLPPQETPQACSNYSILNNYISISPSYVSSLWESPHQARYCRILIKQGLQTEELILCYSQIIKINEGIPAAVSYLTERRNQLLLAKQGSESILLLIALAGLHIQQNNFDKAFDCYLKLAKFVSISDQKILFNMGYCASRLNDFKTAQKYYNDCLILNGQFEEARLNLSNLKAIQSRKLEAISLGKKWPVFSDEFSSNLLVLECEQQPGTIIDSLPDGNCLETVGSVVNKINQAVSLVKLSGNYPQAVNILKWVADKLKSKKIKIPSLQYILQVYLGIFYRKAENHKAAVEVFRQLIQENENSGMNQNYKEIMRNMLNESKSRITRSSKGFRMMLRS